MTKADQKIIDAHPDEAPYDLLQLGLSQKGYQELVDKHDAEVQQPKIQPVVQQVTPQLRAIPALSNIAPGVNSDMAYLVNHQTGFRRQMSRAAAERFVRGGRNKGFTVE